MECQLLQVLTRLSPGLPLFHCFTELKALFSRRSTLQRSAVEKEPSVAQGPWADLGSGSKAIGIVVCRSFSYEHDCSFIELEALFPCR
jgi:hypothetical protein